MNHQQRSVVLEQSPAPHHAALLLAVAAAAVVVAVVGVGGVVDPWRRPRPCQPLSLRAAVRSQPPGQEPAAPAVDRPDVNQQGHETSVR